MKEKSLKIIIGLMSAALLGLIVVQIYWIKNAIELEEKLFDYNVNDAMHTVVKKISQHESATYVRPTCQTRDRTTAVGGIEDLSIPSAG